MESEQNFSTVFGMEISSEELSNCYFHPTNWEIGSSDQTDPFESALSSMVSSPTAPSNGGDGMMIRELIGRLGSICDSDEISPESCIATANNSTNTSCYSTPLNSPPKRFNLSSLITMQNSGGSSFPNHSPNLVSLNADPGFVGRASKYSCFGNKGFVGGKMGTNNYDVRSVPKAEIGKLSRVLSNLTVKALTPENAEVGDSREGSSVSEMNRVQNDANSRKRKSNAKANVRDSPSSASNGKVEAEKKESNGKRSKREDEEGRKENGKEWKNNNSKEKQKNKNDSKEASKDYIHVRARRGQATDSHSLAERVRREKISERMKFLQDLVPGCNKVTGKATVLDEIINYVQSLQRQVEFLSMKLATVNPRMDFNVDALLSKDIISSRRSSLGQTSAQACPPPLICSQSSQQMPMPCFTNAENLFTLNPINAAGILRNIQLPSINGFGDSMTQIPSFWDDDLQSAKYCANGHFPGPNTKLSW